MEVAPTPRSSSAAATTLLLLPIPPPPATPRHLAAVQPPQSDDEVEAEAHDDEDRGEGDEGVEVPRRLLGVLGEEAEDVNPLRPLDLVWGSASISVRASVRVSARASARVQGSGFAPDPSTLGCRARVRRANGTSPSSPSFFAGIAAIRFS